VHPEKFLRIGPAPCLRVPEFPAALRAACGVVSQSKLADAVGVIPKSHQSFLPPRIEETDVVRGRGLFIILNFSTIAQNVIDFFYLKFKI